MSNRRILIFCTLSLLALALPFAASAHEVYVLSPGEIVQAVALPSPNPFTAVPSNELLFLEWGAVVAVLVLVVIAVSISPLFERVFDPFLIGLKKYAPLVARFTFGIALIASGYFGAFFGPELPVDHAISAGLAHAVSLLVIIAGVCVIIGFLTRFMAAIALLIFIFTIYKYGWYMTTYVNYLGEMILFLILGGGAWSLDRAVPSLRRIEGAFARVREVLEPYSFVILRVLFGVSLFFASFYAKFLHSNLALDTVADYHLTNYFPFSPLFLVLGAFIVEALIGFCFATGFEVRFTAIVFTSFLTMSVLFFGESVWPHIILFGVNFALFFHGYDRYTVGAAVFQRARRGEPVL